MEIAEILKKTFEIRYKDCTDLSKFDKEYNPKSDYVQYLITFIDLSTLRVVLTHFQYFGMKRSSIWEQIKHTGGEGYRKKLKAND